MKKDTYKNKIEELKQTGLYRNFKNITCSQERIVCIDNKKFINFSSNNYLNLANNKTIKDAVCLGVKKWGAGSGASRFISGNLEPYTILEQKLAKIKKEEACIVFNSGYTANLGIITALADKDSIIFVDRLNHASIIDAVRLSGAKMILYKHINMNDLKKKIIKYCNTGSQMFLVTDALFSMDGDIAPLSEIHNLAKKYNIKTIIDEAHSFGVFGKTGAGLTEAMNLYGKFDIVMGTLSKSAGLFGGYVCGKKHIIDYIRNKARQLIYTTALPPSILYSANTALDIIVNDNKRREKLWKNIDYFNKKIKKYININTQSQIIPIIIPGNKNVLKISQNLYKSGFLVPAIRYPSVKKGQERLRVSLMSSHTYSDIDQLINFF